jgi:hypothetical protein
MREAKLWAHKDADGKKYYRLLLDDGHEEHIPLLEGLTAQQSFCVLQDSIEEQLGEPCCLTIMNVLAPYDEVDEAV